MFLNLKSQVLPKLHGQGITSLSYQVSTQCLNCLSFEKEKGRTLGRAPLKGILRRLVLEMGILSCAWGYRLLHVSFLFSHFSVIYRGILILIYRANLASSVLVSMQGTGGWPLLWKRSLSSWYFLWFSYIHTFLWQNVVNFPVVLCGK